MSSLVGPNSTLTRNFILKAPQQTCKIYKVILYGASRDNISAPAILPQNDYQVSSSLQAYCESKLEFVWQILSVVNETYSANYKLPKDVQVNDRELVLPSNTLSSGLYKIAFTVISEQHNVSKTEFGFLRVRIPSLIAMIECGSTQILSHYSDVIINASLSYDPTNPTAGSGILNFEWFCQGKSDSWFGNIVRNSSVLRLPSKWLKEGQYLFIVKVMTKGEERKENASQTITIVGYDVPVLCIR